MKILRNIKAALMRMNRSPWTKRLAIFGLVGLVMVAVPVIAQAGPIETLQQIIAKIFELLARLMGFILFLEVKALIAVAQYSNFVAPGPTAVRVGWVVARDLANMFFILVLLVIAFATILSYEEYGLRKLLPRLLITAIVINFSKTITGILIDFGQVVMLTFVNGFKEAAGGNFLNAFQINKLLQLADKSGDTGGLVLGMVLAFIMASVAAAVVLIMLVTLTFRIVMLWVLIILSPIAFLAGTIPQGQTYYKMWWAELKRYVIYGPIVAFFIWLALLSAQISGGNLAEGEGFDLKKTGGASQLEIQSAQQSGGIPTEAAEADVLLSMIIFTGILFAGLKIATSAELAGSGGKFVQGLAKRAVRGAARLGGRAGLAIGKRAAVVGGDRGLQLADTLTSGTYNPLRAIGLNRVVKGARQPFQVQAQRARDRDAARFKRTRDAVLGSPEELARISPAAAAGRYASDLKKAKRAGDTKEVQRLTKGMMEDKSLLNYVKKDKGMNKLTTEALEEGRAKDGNLTGTFYDWQRNDWQNQTQPNTKDRTDAVRKSEVAYMDTEARVEAAPDMAPKQFKQLLEGNQKDQSDAGVILEQAVAPADRAALLNVDPANDGEMNRVREMSPEQAVSEYLNKMRVSPSDIPESMYENPMVAQYAFEQTKNDAKGRAGLMANTSKADAIRHEANRELEAAKASGDSRKIATASVEAIKVGSLSKLDIEGDPVIQGALANNMNPSKLRSGIDTDNGGQVEAATAAMAAMAAGNPDKFNRLKSSGMYEEIMPTNEQIADIGGEVAEAVRRGIEEGAASAQRPSGADERDLGEEGPPLDLA